MQVAEDRGPGLPWRQETGHSVEYVINVQKRLKFGSFIFRD